MFPVELRTPAGLIVLTGAIQVDLERMARVVERTVTGLFYHHTRHPLPEEYSVVAFSVERLKKTGHLEQFGRALAPLAAAPVYTIGADVFEYRFERAPEDENVTGWMLGFYETADFVGATVSTRRLHEGQAQKGGC